MSSEPSSEPSLFDVPSPTPPSTQEESILLVDLSSIAYPVYLMSASDPDPNAASTKIVSRVRSLASSHPHAAICVDKGKSFRAEIDPSYKAQRPEQDAVLHHQIGLAIETLRNDGFPIWMEKGYEADDLIATGVAKAMETEHLSVVIATGDKDLLQLVRPRVVAKSIKDGSIVDEDSVFLKFKVLPFQMRDYLSLCGDSSDNIKGAKGIGPVGAVKLLTKFHSLDRVYEAIDAKTATLPPAVLASLLEFRPRLETVRSLVTMRADAPIKFEEVLAPRVPKDVDLFAEESPMEDTPVEVVPDPEPVTAQTAEPHQNGNGTHTAEMTVMPEVLAPAPAEWNMQLEPRSMSEAVKLADFAYKARLFNAYGHPAGILMTILAGREFGMQAMASLRAFHIIEGKPTMAADLIRAIVLRSGKAKFFRCTERTAERATFETQRGDDPPISLTYTVQEGRTAFAGKAEKWEASGWGKNPADMCVARAGAKLARLVYPDVVHGLFATEEFDQVLAQAA